MKINEFLKHATYLKNNCGDINKILQNYEMKIKEKSLVTGVFIYESNNYFNQIIWTIKNDKIISYVLYADFDFKLNDLKEEFEFLGSKYVPYDDMHIKKFKILSLGSSIWFENESANQKITAIHFIV